MRTSWNASQTGSLSPNKQRNLFHCLQCMSPMVNMNMVAMDVVDMDVVDMDVMDMDMVDMGHGCGGHGRDVSFSEKL